MFPFDSYAQIKLIIRDLSQYSTGEPFDKLRIFTKSIETGPS